MGNKFSYRVPDDMVLLRCFMGGDALGKVDESLVDPPARIAAASWAFKPSRSFHSIARWPNSMAQYTVGHAQRHEQIESIVKEIPGLHLAGNGYRGIGSAGLHQMGKEAARSITS